jgi:hypothetical protein
MIGRRSNILLLICVLAVSHGCGSSTAAPTGTSHVRLLTALFAKASLKLRRPPKDEREFKQTLAESTISPDSLHVGTLAELFTSERDGQPLVVLYGTPKGSDVVVYERTGVDGKRLIGHRIGMVEEVDEAQFSALKLKTP